MSAMTVCSIAPVAVVARPQVQGRKTFAGAKVAQKATVKAVVKTTTVCKAEEQKQKVSAAAVAAATAVTTFPGAAFAYDSTDSVQYLINSFVAGGVVVGAILVAVFGVATFDKVKRS
eukprot:CAMPEP_0118956388 /NCGR_PEP_ID=MMETSP1169-20130426/61550_1 /TAXON_ID=36882 /ORGANISM="Pyramimonas obovata, Strain CCMP722" /LENGTH=116 /DNA_ID=CAMNT_0006904415 /DNA_START=94 /DNA_END=444 /DNA_ORIENTATION=+